MNENEIAAQDTERLDEPQAQIANMDEFDYLTLLMESRIVQF